MNTHWSRTGLSLAAVLALAAGSLSASGAPEPPAEHPAPTTDSKTPAATADHAPRAAEGVRVAPVAPAPNIPGQVGGDMRPGTGLLLAEGTFVANRRGVMERLATGDWQFVFDNETGVAPLAPMTLQPCQRLAEIVRIVEARPERVVFTLSGRVFVYAGHNFLLPTIFATATQQNDTSTESAEKHDVKSPVDSANPSVQDLVADVDHATRPAENPRTAATSASGGEGAPHLRREGTAIVSQTGHISRGGRSWVFTIDNDPDTKPGDEETAPLELLPCLSLAEMERLFERHGNALRFVISGSVFTYKERNMLLPTMYVVDVDRDGNLTSAQ